MHWKTGFYRLISDEQSFFLIPEGHLKSSADAVWQTRQLSCAAPVKRGLARERLDSLRCWLQHCGSSNAAANHRPTLSTKASASFSFPRLALTDKLTRSRHYTLPTTESTEVFTPNPCIITQHHLA